MLNYSVKLGDIYIKKSEVVWGEKYLSPDLSFVSGVTSQDYHLETLTTIEASINGKTDLLGIECENVTREGYVVVKGKKYKVDTVNNVVLINGKYYNVKSGKISIDDWLVQAYSVRHDYNPETERYDKSIFIPGVTTSAVTASVSNNYAILDTIYWIENGKVNIDGNDYYFDRDEVSSNGKGALKYFEGSAALPATGVTDCESIDFFPIQKADDFVRVTKFKLTRGEDRSIAVDNITFISHFYYALHNGTYHSIEANSSGEYGCDLGKVWFNDNTQQATSGTVGDYESLGDYDCMVKLGEGCYIPVYSTVQNANGGRKIGLYLTDAYDNFTVGDIITARRPAGGYSDLFKVETDNGKTFVVNDGTRYDVVDGMMSTVIINDVEYDIVYCDDTNCFVKIGDEEVPMEKTEDGLKRYGKEKTYSIKSYSGVTVNGVSYRITPIYQEYDDDSEVIGYNFSGEPELAHRLRVIETIGSSLLVCEADLYSNEFTEGFINNKMSNIASELVFGQKEYVIYRKNSLFGEREVLPHNGEISTTDATSSDDFQNVLGTLVLYANIGYIEIPIKLNADIAMNHLIDDTRDRDFVEVETQKAINPIVDMERDVYVPKYIDNSTESIMAYTAACASQGIGTDMIPSGMHTEDLKHSYIGSFTDFKPVTEIQINPHFRTRNMENWKVNEGYNDASTSGTTDNWFITDYQPYKTLIEDASGYTDEYMEVSDVLGLLYFDNMDIFYQKSAVAKTFLRLSYYDSTNQQTQSMLHSSTVFMNEHDLFKKYMDNSRKNVYDYMYVSEPVPEEHLTGATTGDTEIHPEILNKISVFSEFIGVHNKIMAKSLTSGYTFNDAKILEEDRRISSRFSIVNKYATDTSSEGFYLYIFKEYATNLHPQPIYMKVEFNHAKLGKTIPFNIPMKWAHSEEEVEDSPYVYPTERITLSDTINTGDTGSTSDLELLKQGIPLSYVYGQSYIPLYAMYDFKNKEYAYIFDDRYVGEITDGIVKLNLFELKIKNNEDGEAEEKTARIDINNRQIVVE